MSRLQNINSVPYVFKINMDLYLRTNALYTNEPYSDCLFHLE